MGQSSSQSWIPDSFDQEGIEDQAQHKVVNNISMGLRNLGQTGVTHMEVIGSDLSESINSIERRNRDQSPSIESCHPPQLNLPQVRMACSTLRDC